MLEQHNQMDGGAMKVVSISVAVIFVRHHITQVYSEARINNIGQYSVTCRRMRGVKDGTKVWDLIRKMESVN